MMIKKLLLCLCIAFYSSSTFAVIGTWTAKAAMPTERSTHVAFSLNGQGFICGGADYSTNFNDLWAYNPSTNTWTQKASFPGDGRQELSSFVIGNYAYVGLGRNVNTGECFKSFYRYDPINDQWSQVADCPVKRYAAGSFSIGTTGYVTCGLAPNEPRYNDLYAYNPSTNTWSQKTSLPTLLGGRAFPCTVSANGKAYLMGGFTGSIIYNDLWEYNPNSDAWTFIAFCPLGQRSYSLGFTLSNKIFFGMGRGNNNTNNQDWLCYNPANNTWDSVSNYPQNNTIGGACFTLNSKAYVCGGFNVADSVMNYTNELSDPSLGLKSNNQINLLKPYFAQNTKQIFSNAFAGELKLRIYNLNGQEVMNKNINVGGDSKIQIDLSSLETGLYVASISNAGETKIIKIVLQ